MVILMQALFTLLDKTRVYMRALAAFCLCCMALVTGTDVVGRFVGRPVFGSEEIVTMLAVFVVGLSLPDAHAERSHIGVEIFVRYMPRALRRGLRMVTTATALGLFGVVTWRMADYALTMRESGVRSMNLQLPEYLVVFVLAFGFLIFTLHLLRDVLEFFNPNPAKGTD
ncbi:MAG: TRAP transporter small permease [Desulfovibrio sp.]